MGGVAWIPLPHVLTTYRLTEHHTAGGMSRTLSHLAELQPALFWRSRRSSRAKSESRTATGPDRDSAWRIRARALVTPRIRPLIIHGRTRAPGRPALALRQKGLVTGDVVNDLIAMSEEPNVKIMESKG